MALNEFSFAFPEETFGKDYLVATYYIEMEAGSDALKKASSVAVGQSIGTWVKVPGMTDEMMAKHCGKVVGLFDVPPVELSFNLPQTEKRALIMQIAYPEINFAAEYPMMLTVLLGNDVSTSAQMKLLDLHFSPGMAAQFGGPKFGIRGIRELLGVPKRPLILNVIKPNTGFTPEVGAGFFEESARGGSDIIKDDELLMSNSFNHALDRVKAYHAAAIRAYEDTGHRAFYCVNITDRPDKLLENAHKAIELGADLIMINAVTAGLGTLQAAAADPDITIPILTHYATTSSLSEGHSSGMTSVLLLGKLMRLCGSDATSFNSPYSVYPLLKENFIRAAQFMKLSWYDLKPSLPVPGGGIHPASAAQIAADIGNDVLMAIGGAIQGHPGGATAGAKAMRQTMDAIVAGRSLDDAAQEFDELRQAVEIWGSRVVTLSS